LERILLRVGGKKHKAGWLAEDGQIGGVQEGGPGTPGNRDHDTNNDPSAAVVVRGTKYRGFSLSRATDNK